MVENTEKKPGWAENPLYEEGVTHFEAGEWEEAVEVFSELAAEFPDDQELQQILADLRLKAALSRGEVGRGRMPLRRLQRPALIAVVVVALIAVLAGGAYAINARLRQAQEQAAHEALRIQSLDLCRAYIAAEDYERAVEVCADVVEQWPHDETAAALLERAEELQELSVPYDTALQLTQEEKWYEARWAWRTVCAMDCNFKDTRYWLEYVERQDVLYSLFADAEDCYGSQDWNCAVELLERVRGQNANYRRNDVEPLLASSLVNLAKQMLSDASDPADVYSEVMELFDEAIQIRPQEQSLVTERTVAVAYSESFARFQEKGCEGSVQKLQVVYVDGDALESPPAQQLVIVYEANILCGDERMQARDYQGARVCYEAALELPIDDLSEANSKYAALVPMLTPTATATRRPPTPTPTRRPATPTATAVAWGYVQLGDPVYRSNDKNSAGCDWLGVGGQVVDAAGSGLTGVTVRVWSGGWQGHTSVSGQKPEYGSGGWEVYLDDHPKNGVWSCQVIDQSGAGLSPVVQFQTYARACNANLILISFKKTS